jgi:hypothetical protein
MEHESYLALQNFLTKEECEGIVLSNDITLVKDKINKAIFEWNDNPEHSFIVDYSEQYRHTILSGDEETEVVKTAAHVMHKDNFWDTPWKIQAYINLADTDEYQGGEILLDKWPQVPYQDNFGKWNGDPEKPHQPRWMNEQGTLFVAHAGKRVGFDRTTNGSSPRLRILVGGPAYK